MIAAPPFWREVKASYALVERNINLSKRYWAWEAAFLVYTIAQSMAVVYMADAVPSVTHHHAFNTRAIVLYLAIGTLTWSYMASLFMAIAESVQWERWEGTIEYTLMAPISRLTYVLGSCLFAVIYGLARTVFVLAALMLTFHLEANGAGLMPALLIVAVGSVSFVGIGIMAATLPLLFTEKGAQMTYVIEACLLLISGVYYPVSVLPIWMQVFSHISPATYILSGIRTMLLGHPSEAALMGALIPLIVIGIVTVPLGVWLFAWAEHFAKRTGRLKRTG
ncbi:MAG TPA: ABC transporter permease [Chloroflexota bacterium]|nr:ABC transporter permease [Chloroflexota bacterium]